MKIYSVLGLLLLLAALPAMALEDTAVARYNFPCDAVITMGSKPADWAAEVQQGAVFTKKFVTPVGNLKKMRNVKPSKFKTEIRGRFYEGFLAFSITCFMPKEHKILALKSAGHSKAGFIKKEEVAEIYIDPTGAGEYSFGISINANGAFFDGDWLYAHKATRHGNTYRDCCDGHCDVYRCGREVEPYRDCWNWDRYGVCSRTFCKAIRYGTRAYIFRPRT